jgi:hypothetical protein
MLMKEVDMRRNLTGIKSTASCIVGLAGVAMMLGWISPAFPLPIVQSDITNANPPSVQDPVRIDRTVNDQFGNFYHAIVDEPTLEMKGLVNSAPSIRSGTAQLDDLILGDSLTFQGLPVSGQAIRFELIANGTGFLPSTIPSIGPVLIDEFLRLNLNMGGPPVGTDNASVAVSYVNQGPGSPGIIPEAPDVAFPILWDLTATRMISNGVPEPFNMNMTLAAPEGAQFDFLNTARLVIDLPPGSSVMSAGGFFEEGPAAVPEPSSIVLLGCALAALMFFPSATARVPR